MNLALDDSGDLFRSANRVQTVTGRDEIKQKIINRLYSIRGEWFLNLNSGIPFFQKVVGKVPNVETIRSTYVEAITTVTGVTELISLTLDLDSKTRTLTTTWAARTLDGIISFPGN